MRKWRAKPDRVAKGGPAWSLGGNKVHDEDALRWKHLVSQQEALALLSQAGPGTPCLPANHVAPAMAPEACSSAVDYTRALQDDARQAVFKHCQLVSRHERLLLEGQERLKYVQTHMTQLKAQLQPGPPAGLPGEPPPHAAAEAGGQATARKGPDVQVIPLRRPTCWASCCGLLDLPGEPLPLPLQPTQPVPPPHAAAAAAAAALPLPLPLPPPAYFQEAAQATLAARRRQMAASQGGVSSPPLGSTGGAARGAHHPGAEGSGGGASQPLPLPLPLPPAATAASSAPAPASAPPPGPGPQQEGPGVRQPAAP
ncbi:hypothetical protein Agub_g6083, partial [Astrephomene gubernaculifera]